MNKHNYFVYITTNPRKTTLYTGVTNNLKSRLAQHFDNCGDKKSFAGRYYCYNLIFWEVFDQIEYAIAREKEIKGWRREKKVELINHFNPQWRFLNNEI